MSANISCIAYAYVELRCDSCGEFVDDVSDVKLNVDYDSIMGLDALYQDSQSESDYLFYDEDSDEYLCEDCYEADEEEDEMPTAKFIPAKMVFSS